MPPSRNGNGKNALRPERKDLPVNGKLAAFDSEDDSCGNLTQIVLVTDDDTAHHLDPNPAAFYSAMLALGPEYTVYAHNLEYDVGNCLRGYLSKCTPTLGGGDRLISVSIQNGPLLRDTAAHFRRSLANVGRLVGMEKGILDANDPEYCERDARITLAAARYLQSFYHSVNARFSATSSGSTLSQFKRNFLDREQPLPDWIMRMREAYYGGRTECFRVGDLKNVYSADINSAYGWAMSTLPYPDTSSGEIVERMDLESEGVCHVEISLPSHCNRSPIPFRTAAGNVFPCGRATGWWAMPEIRYAKRIGAHIKLGRGIRFGSTFQPFRDFVNEHYKVKQRSTDPAERFFRKLLVNSLYGMFGLGPVRLTYMKSRTGRGTPWGAGELVKMKRIAPFANQIWAIYTTAYVRVRLAELMDETQARGGEPVYCDTDSIFYTASNEIWPEDDTLGALSGEGREDMTIRAPKCYAWGEKVRIKGIPKARREHLDGMPAVVETPRRLLIALKKDEAVNVWRKTTREIKGTYTRRTVLPDGSTRPLVVTAEAARRSR